MNNKVPYFPEYKLHLLSSKSFDMRLILRMREKGGVTVDFTLAWTACSLAVLEAMQLDGFLYVERQNDALVVIECKRCGGYAR
jgi:hypothetical protein